MEQIKVVLNPYSGRGNGRRTEAKIRQALEEQQIPYDLVHTQGVHHGTELARQARLEGYRIVAAAGGDGTVSEVVNGLAQAADPAEPVGTLAILPVGSANDFADMAGVPRDLDRAAAAIGAAVTRAVDLGQIRLAAHGREQLHYFNNNLGCGFEAQITVESRKIKRLRGILIYLAAVFRALGHYQQPRMQLQWESPSGEQLSRDQTVLMVSIGNSRRTGGGFYVTPNAELDDGLFDMAIAGALSRLEIVKLLPRVMQGTHTSHPALTFVRSPRIHLVSPDPLPVHADGEVICLDADVLDISLQPGRLQVIYAAPARP